jgi:hypothetical protein
MRGQREILIARLHSKVCRGFRVNIITPASKHIKGCHAGPRIESGAGFDKPAPAGCKPGASSPILDSRLRGNDDGDAIRIPVIPLFGLILLLPLLIAWADS